MMDEWVYKATKTKVGAQDTKLLADMGFLCRSSRTKTGAWPANVKKVKIGSLIHFFYVGGREKLAFGKYEVISPDMHREPELFGESVPECELYVPTPGRRLDATLSRLAGYTIEERWRGYPGWVIRQVGDTSLKALDSFPEGSKGTLIRLGTP